MTNRIYWGWKVIAHRLQRSISTAKRLERRCELPVQRDGMVFLTEDAIQAWLERKNVRDPRNGGI